METYEESCDEADTLQGLMRHLQLFTMHQCGVQTSPVDIFYRHCRSSGDITVGRSKRNPKA